MKPMLQITHSAELAAGAFSDLLLDRGRGIHVMHYVGIQGSTIHH